MLNETRKSEYLSNHWFEELERKGGNSQQFLDDFCRQPDLESLTVDFSAFGVLQEKAYFATHYQNLERLLKNLRGREFTEFKFRCRSWKEINPLPLLSLIYENIQSVNLSINLSGIQGSKEILQLLLSRMFSKRYYNKIEYQLENWRINFRDLKILEDCFIQNDPKELIFLDLSGCGRSLDEFFQCPEADAKKMVPQLHKTLETYFQAAIMTSECIEIRIVMENWHNDFGLQTLKAKLDALINEHAPQKSLNSRAAQQATQTNRIISFKI